MSELIKASEGPGPAKPCSECLYLVEEQRCRAWLHIVSGKPQDALGGRMNDELCGREGKDCDGGPAPLIVGTECGGTIFCGACGRETESQQEEEDAEVEKLPQRRPCHVAGCEGAMLRGSMGDIAVWRCNRGGLHVVAQ